MKTLDQFSTTPSKFITQYSDKEQQINDNHYMCSPLVFPMSQNTHPHIINYFQNVIHNKCILSTNNNNDEFQTSFTLDDINEKISTAQNTPTDEIFSKLQINDSDKQSYMERSEFIDLNLDEVKMTSTLDTDETPSSSTSLGVECCNESGNLFCCENFEQRIFQWVEQNVPVMAKPEEKMESYFQNRRNTLITSMCISQKPSEFQIDVVPMDLSLTSSCSSITQCSISTISLLNKNAPSPQIIRDRQSTHSMKVVDNGEKFGSNLLKRRQSQAISYNAKHLTLGKRLSIKTVTQPFIKGEENN